MGIAGAGQVEIEAEVKVREELWWWESELRKIRGVVLQDELLRSVRVSRCRL